MEDLKHTFSIQLPIGLYKKIVNEAGKGKVSTFIRGILERELGKSEDKLVNEYQECYANPRMIKEAKQ